MDHEPVDSTNAPGWRPDPYGRGQFRYYDGQRWTASIATNGVTTTDPLGVTASIPFTMPTGLAGPPTAPLASPIPGMSPASGPTPLAAPPAVGFLESMGGRATARPTPTLRGAFGAVGGLILAGGVTGLILADDDVSSAVGAMIGVLLIAAAGFGSWKTSAEERDVQSASISIAAFGIATFAAALTSSDPGTNTFLVAGALALAAWIARPFRGTAFFLGAGTISILFGLALQVAESSSDSGPYGSSSGFRLFGGLLPSTRNAGIFLLIATLVLAMLARRVDTRGYHGISTPLLASALVSALIGLTLAGVTIDATGAYCIAAAAGVLLASVGSRGDHRATTWFGAILGGFGAVAAITSAVDPSSPRAIGAIALVVGALVVAGPRLAAKVAADNAKSDGAPRADSDQPQDHATAEVSDESGARP